MSGNTITQTSNGETYDIDGFINQLLESQKFDELAEKVADKAVNKIKNIDAPTAHLERFSDANQINTTIENTQQKYQGKGGRKYVKEYDKGLLNNIQLRNGNGLEKQGIIDTQAVMMDETTSQSENLRLKYKYLTRNVYNKKVFSDQASEKADHPVPENEDQSKQNEMTGSGDKSKDHVTKTKERTSNQNATGKNQYNPKKELIDENDNWRHDIRDDNHKDVDSNRNSKPFENPHSGMDGEINENIDKNNHLREEMSPRHEQTNLREAQNPKPEFKDIVENEKQEASHADNSTTEEEENLSKLDEENEENVLPSEEKSTKEKIAEEVEKAEEEPEKSDTEENVEENRESAAPQMRAHDEDYPNVEENKVNFDNNAYKSSYRSSGSDDNSDRIEEHREQFPENQEMADQKEDLESSSYKPVIRKEGDKLFTFVEAPEYEEYHEQLAKMRKEHPENPLDFII